MCGSRSKSRYTANRPSLDNTQRRVVQELHDAGFSLVSFADLFPEAVTLTNGVARVPEAPGLGVTLDVEVLRKYEWRGQPAPALV